MSGIEPAVTLVNVDRRFAVLASGEVMALTNLIDDYGDETGIAGDVVAVVGQMADGRWLSVNLAMLDRVRTN